MVSDSLSQSAAAMNLGPQRILDPVTRDAVLAALRDGNKIKAIKFYRLSTGAGLLEAKNAVESIAVQNNIVATAPANAMRFPVSSLLLFGIAVAVGVAIYYGKFAH